METRIVLLLFLAAIATSVIATTTPPTRELRCRVCSRARSLHDCTRIAYATGNEICYTEKLIDTSGYVYYNAGVRDKAFCTQITSQIQGRRDIAICARCCEGTDSCNEMLCGLNAGNASVGSCYFCDHSLSTQWEVANPRDCVTLTTYQIDEFCYSGKYSDAGTESYQYGCKKKTICRLLMERVFEEFDRCYNKTDPFLCGDSLHQTKKRVSPLCHSCCGYTNCNYGSCYEIKERMYLYYRAGQLDITTLAPLN